VDLAAQHRTRADDERAKAASTNLENRRAMYLRSAEMWDEMARAIDDTTARALVNETAKAAAR
jgi:hypothetical protein